MADEGPQRRPDEELAGERDERAQTVPLPGDDGDHVIGQQTVGAQAVIGGGEWPSPHAPPTGPAPGTADEGESAADRRAEAPPRRPPEGSASQPDRQQDGTGGGDRGAARHTDLAGDGEAEIDPPEGFKEVLEGDRVTGGSQSVPPDDPGPGPTPAPRR